METDLLTRIQETHVAIWNEKDRARRVAMMQTIYAANIQMYDKDFTLTDTEAIADFIDKLFADDADFLFTAEKPMDSTQHGARLYWTIRTGPQPNTLTGMDFFVLEDEKIAHLFVFMNAP
ncbi:hypothetical protein GGR92_000726 [Spirosoma lacussanchae]|uniref:nuclear transport factor 2 family protein n=1 Tax=Spirosoma lacussanchae TaxID=1884249 RepID=UPI0011091323|nr:nuclear transport factor 2 family protein [Spirosoma lacussanchae]